MGFIEAIVLGIIQGLTEFLPVSSSGHIEIMKELLGVKPKDQNLLMTVVLHAATALSTIVIFRSEVQTIFSGLFKLKWNDEFKFSLLILISMLPAALVGLFFESELDLLFSGNILLVGSCLIITGLLLFLADRAKSTNKKISYLNAFTIGISQAIAILPGISRSGATISTSVLLGVDREKAAKFSFLMVVPLILGKMAKDMYSSDFLLNESQFSILAVGFIASFITGLLACKWMIRIVKNSQLKYFSYYCFIIGILSISASLI